MSVGKIKEFDVDTGNWTLYCERVELYFKANGVKEELRLPTLIALAGERAYELMVNLASPKKPSQLEFAELVKLVGTHLQPKPSVMAERYKFRQRRQCSTENVTQYMASLKQLSRYCEFGANLDENLRDQFVCGVLSDLIRQRLFAEDGLTFNKAMNLASTLEAAERDAAAVESGKKQESQAPGINAMKSRGRTACTVCGHQGHDSKKCRYRNLTCDKCQVKGHLKRVCSKPTPELSKEAHGKINNRRRNNFFTELQSDRSESEEEGLTEPIFQMSLSEYKAVSVTLQVDGKPLKMEIDTGTPASCISKSMYDNLFSNLAIQKIKTCFNSYTGDRINPIGIITPIVQYKDSKKQLDLYIVDKGITTLIGRQWLTQLGIELPMFKLESGANVNNLCNSIVVKEADKLSDLFNRYANVFEEGLGCYTGGEAVLRVRADAVPVYCRARQLPYSLRHQVDAELDAMLKEGVIEPVDCSDWATPLVPVHKKDGGLRVCADFKVTLNPHLLVDRYPLPKVQDMFANLAGGVTYSKIDLSQAYNQICLSEESKPYTVINTHRGLFRYNRLVYGLASSCGIFQRIISKVIQDIPNTQAFLDDIIITGDESSHWNNVDAVLARLQQYGLKVKKGKCVFFANEIKYLGYIVSKDGIKPDPSKIESITNMPIPTNVSDLRSFLGMVNFYAKFVHKISDYLYPLYELLKKGRRWIWSASCTAAFNKVKELLAGKNVLVHYDPEQPLVLTCDASSRGIGGVLSQVDGSGVERPIAYVSRKLTCAERSYSQIHREALAIVYCVQKYHQYLYGRQFTLKTDHKPLVSIFGPQSGIPGMAAARMQRWAIILSAYEFNIEYVRSEKNGADALSRLPIDGPSQDRIELSDQSYLHFASTALLLDCEEVKKLTCRDPVLSRVVGYIDKGWPKDLDRDNLRPYWNRRDELYTELGCIMWGHRVVVPPQGRIRVLNELHEPHMGIVKTKAMARSYVWWPGIDEEIEACCKSCTVCAENAAAPAGAPPAPWRWPHRPYERVHVDFLGPIEGCTYLITVDARSKWIEVFKMKRTTADSTIKKLRESWSRWGLPRQVVSDNGPPFSSKEFNEFLDKNGIKHIYSPPYHPASNGAAENAVKVIKRVIKKAKTANTDIEIAISRFLLSYHNTPHTTTGECPAKLLQGRVLRTRLDALRPNYEDTVEVKQAKKVTADDTTRRLSEGDSVWYRTYNTSDKWRQGQVLECLGKNNYNVTSAEGTLQHRHIDQLRRVSRRSTCVYPSTETSVSGDERSPPVVSSPDRAGSRHPTPVQHRVPSEAPTHSGTNSAVRADRIEPDDRAADTMRCSPTLEKTPSKRPVRNKRPPKRLILEID